MGLTKKGVIIAFVLGIFLLSGCASISQEQAEQITGRFIDENVKFYAKDKEGNLNLSAYAKNSITSYREGEDWMVITHITSTVENETKQSDLSVKVDKDGKVIEFNNMPVPESMNVG